MSIRILLADDHNMVRRGLRLILGLDPELEIVGEAIDGLEAVRMAAVLAPDLVIMDMTMPGMDGIAATVAIRAARPQTQVLIVSSLVDEASVLGAVRAGAVGYLLKNSQDEDLCRAVRAAAQGHIQLAPQAAAFLVREVRAPENPEQLSEREKDVLRLLAQGQSNKEIANVLGIGDKTVKTHVSNILAKLGCQSRTQAALFAARIGLAPSP